MMDIVRAASNAVLADKQIRIRHGGGKLWGKISRASHRIKTLPLWQAAQITTQIF